MDLDMGIGSPEDAARPSPQQKQRMPHPAHQQMTASQKQTAPIELEEVEEVGNAAPVRLPNELGFGPDWVDCPTCGKRRRTKIIKVPSDHTR